MVLDPIPQPLHVHFFGSRPQPPTSPSHINLALTNQCALLYLLYLSFSPCSLSRSRTRAPSRARAHALSLSLSVARSLSLCMSSFSLDCSPAFSLFSPSFALSHTHTHSLSRRQFGLFLARLPLFFLSLSHTLQHILGGNSSLANQLDFLRDKGKEELTKRTGKRVLQSVAVCCSVVQ